MNEKEMKNIIVLKEVNSNIVEEAIVILKPRINIKSIKCTEGKNLYEKTNENFNKDYILNEAQNVISSYVSKIEEKNSKTYVKIEKKYKKIKLLNYFLIVLLILNIIFRII